MEKLQLQLKKNQQEKEDLKQLLRDSQNKETYLKEQLEEYQLEKLHADKQLQKNNQKELILKQQIKEQQIKSKKLKTTILYKEQIICGLQNQQSSQERWSSFIQSNIYKTIEQESKKQDIHVKTIDCSKIKLDSMEWTDLQLTIDSIFNNFTEKLKNDFPKLTNTDIYYCYLSLFELSLSQKAALMGQDYNAVSKRKQRLEKEKMNTDNIFLILKKYL